VAIVGGGASGLMCALELLSGDNPLKGEDVLVLERNDRVGKKLIATGNGQCNLSNALLLRENFYGDADFLDAFYSKLKEFDLENYLNSFGIYLKTDEEGRKYPLSLSANSFLDVILEFLYNKNLSIKTSQKIIKLNKKNGVFTIASENQCFYAENLVLAVGGTVGAQFGTDGTSYDLATNFGHNLTALYPSLVQLKTDTSNIKSLKGIKEKAKVSAISCGKVIKSAVGDLLFTDYGISGSTVFKISGSLIDKQDKSVKIEFLPELSIKELEDILEKRKTLSAYQNEKIFWGLVNKRVANVIYKTVRSNNTIDLAKALKNFTLKVTGSLGNNYAQVTKGGIKTQDVNPFTMKSKKQDGLYLLGEMLDVDGDCGGFNLTFAFSSAVFCAKHVKTLF
jgi:predicted Rossmann fold flavoprotein